MKFWQHHLHCEVKSEEPLHHYSEGSDYSDDSAFVGVFNGAVDHLIIRLALDDRRVNLCLVQLAAGLSQPMYLSPPLRSSLRWKQGSFSHRIPHSCITIEPCCAFCRGNGRQEEAMSRPHFDRNLSSGKISLKLYDKSLSTISVCTCGSTCVEVQSAINLSTCCQPLKIITHNDGLLFLYCYSKNHSIQVLSDIWNSFTF